MDKSSIILAAILAIATGGMVVMPADAESPIEQCSRLPETGEVFTGVAAAHDRIVARTISDPECGKECDKERDKERDSDLRDGWPLDLATPTGGFPYTATLYDADGDGADEIFLTGGHTFALRGDGTFLPGWPTAEMEHMGYGTNANQPGPSAADLDGDGDTEVLWTLRDWWAGGCYMWCFNGKNLDGTNLAGFPQAAPDQSSNALHTPFVLGDTDGDGDLEAWGAHTLGNTSVDYRISAFDHLGTRMFTIDLNPAETIESLYFGDLDGDDTSEMFGVSWLDPSFRLHLFAANGEEVSGYPIVLHTLSSGWLMFGPPIPVDLDDDGDLEILLGCWDSWGSRAHCYHHDGTLCAGFPIQIATSSQLFYLGLGDLTGDGEPELLAFDNHLGGDYRVHVLDLATGVPLTGWPYDVPDWPKGFPTVVDVDNDGLQDLCFVTDGAELHAVSGDGQLIYGYPKYMSNASISGVAAGDIDGDGLFELVATTWDGWVYAWDTRGEVLPGRADWPMRGLNARNTGVFGDRGAASAVLDGPSSRQLDLVIQPNPVCLSAEFLFESSMMTPVALEIFDPNGRLVDAMSIAGERRLVWQPLPSYPVGVYLARLKGDRASTTARFVVLR